MARTARPITAAALIMAAVFGCFLIAGILELKEFGFALAAAVILDATLVRLLLAGPHPAQGPARMTSQHALAVAPWRHCDALFSTEDYHEEGEFR